MSETFDKRLSSWSYWQKRVFAVKLSFERFARSQKMGDEQAPPFTTQDFKSVNPFNRLLFLRWASKLWFGIIKIKIKTLDSMTSLRYHMKRERWMNVHLTKQKDGSKKSNLSRNPENEPHSAEKERGWTHCRLHVNSFQWDFKIGMCLYFNAMYFLAFSDFATWRVAVIHHNRGAMYNCQMSSLAITRRWRLVQIAKYYLVQEMCFLYLSCSAWTTTATGGCITKQLKMAFGEKLGFWCMLGVHAQKSHLARKL